jgi:hypothetical protein
MRHRTAVLWGSILAIATIIPPLNVVRIIATVGENNLSNDYVVWASPVSRMLLGTYPWRSIFRDAFFPTGHFMLFPFLLHAAVAWLAQWNVFVEMYLGVGLFLLKLVLLHRLLAPRSGGLWAWALWPVLSALVFSTSQLSVFTFGDSAIQMGLCQVGLLAGLCGVVLRSNRWAAIGWMTAGGILAAWSWGGGVMAWPIFLLAMLLLGFRRPAHYAGLASGAAVAATPYFYFLFVSPSLMKGSPVAHSPDLAAMADLLGRPMIRLTGMFLEPIPGSMRHGILGLLLLATALGLLLLRRAEGRSEWAVPSLLLASYGVLAALQIGVFRSAPLPWYNSPMMFLWIGLAGLAWLFLSPAGLAWENAGRGWAVITIFVIGAFSIRSTRLDAAQSFYLESRRPASASCLRRYATAPTYCERLLFQWGIGHPHALEDLARPLERSRLSVFAPRQCWTLQGEFVAGIVETSEGTSSEEAFWRDRSGLPASPLDLERLDLVLPPDGKVCWTFRLPAALSKAEFRAGLIRGSPAIALEADGGHVRTVFPADKDRGAPEDVRVSLLDGSGRRLMLVLRGGGTGETILRCPRIELDGNGGTGSAGEPVRPSNTDLSPVFPAPRPDDYTFNLADPALWREHDMTPAFSSGAVRSWFVGPLSWLEYTGPLDLDLGGFESLAFRCRVSPGLSPRAVMVRYLLNGESTFSDAHTFDIPLLGDDREHGYSVDLKLLGSRRRLRLTGLRIDPAAGVRPSPSNQVWLSNVRLVKTTPASGSP